MLKFFDFFALGVPILRIEDLYIENNKINDFCFYLKIDNS